MEGSLPASPAAGNGGARGEYLAGRGAERQPGPFPKQPCRKGRGHLRVRGPPQRAIQPRHLVPGASGSGWALLSARTGAHYVGSSHMARQQLGFGFRGALQPPQLSPSAPGVPGAPRPAFGARARPGGPPIRGAPLLSPGLGTASSASPAKPGRDSGRLGGGGCLHQREGRLRAPPHPFSPLQAVWVAQPRRPA